MIVSILDNDLYKFSMQSAVCKLFPREVVRFEFINRGTTIFSKGFAKKLRNEVELMTQHYLTELEVDFLHGNCYYFDPVYIDFLRGYKYDPAEVTIKQTGGTLKVIVEGYWYRTILWEVPLLAMISELYFKETGQIVELFTSQTDIVKNNKSSVWSDHNVINPDVLEPLLKKIGGFAKLGAYLAEFGTRRRYSYMYQELETYYLSKIGGDSFFVGTSNVHLARIHGIKPIGTHAHEWFMFHAAKYGFKLANEMALENWASVYQGDLGIALTDTFTTDDFYSNFNTKLSKLFDGVRHDSGDPFDFIEKTVSHYKSKGIDPRSKTIIFSDGLNLKKATEIYRFCIDEIKCSFGIGTYLSNDVGVKPLNIVIKMTHVLVNNNWVSAIKLSDDVGKHTGDSRMIDLAKNVLRV